MNTIRGNQLTPDDQKQALRFYVHRYTGDHTPNWVRYGRTLGIFYPLQFINDTDWLANTLFVVRKDGRLTCRNVACLSNPTWPNNPELRGVAVQIKYAEWAP